MEGGVIFGFLIFFVIVGVNVYFWIKNPSNGSTKPPPPPSSGSNTPPPPPPPPAVPTYLDSGKGYWDPNGPKKYMCPDALNVNLLGNSGDYANYCIFNAENAVRDWCNKDTTCVGYVENGGMYQALNTPAVLNNSIPNSTYWVKKI